jgi:hypothetical protein
MPPEDHPGYLGLTSEGVIAIHADWPIYPIEHGLGAAVTSLGAFPGGTTFRPISDIDRCVLLVAEGYGETVDPFGPRAFQVAIWHKDLLAGLDRGLVEGVERLSEREYEERRRRDLWHTRGRQVDSGLEFTEEPGFQLYFQHPETGEHVPIQLPPLDEYDDDKEGGRPCLGVLPAGIVQLTSAGSAFLESLWNDEFFVPEEIRSRLQPLLGNGLYDTALRELGVLIETRLRRALSSTRYGSQLIDEYIAALTESGEFLGTGVKILRGELRTAFMFVRNEFAHNLIDLAASRGYALISRMCRLAVLLDEVESGRTNLP